MQQEATEQLALIDSQGCQFLISCFGDSPDTPTFFSCSSTMRIMKSGFTVLEAITGVVYDTFYTCHNVISIGRVDGMPPDICNSSYNALQEEGTTACYAGANLFLGVALLLGLSTMLIAVACMSYVICRDLKASQDLNAERQRELKQSLLPEPADMPEDPMYRATPETVVNTERMGGYGL